MDYRTRIEYDKAYREKLLNTMKENNRNGISNEIYAGVVHSLVNNRSYFIKVMMGEE